MKKYIYHLIIALMLCPGVLRAQSLQIQGTIRDAKETLVGASVLEKGTSNGTVTDYNGNFKLVLKNNPSVLVLRYVGYLSKEVRVSAGANLNITLDVDAKGLEEVVVVGYAQKKQITNLGAVSQISGATIDGIPNANVQNDLVGRLPGLSSQQRSGEPGRDNANIYIRGSNSLLGNNSALIIVDDIQYDPSQLSQLDPNEIETVSILKDATTTAIYGIKGANGVVVITTKRGRAGKPQFNFSTSYGRSQYIKTPKFLDAYTSATLRNQALANDGLPADFSANDLALYQSGADPYGHPNSNWESILLNKSAPQSQSNLDVSGGSDIVKYFINLGIFNQNSQLKDLDPNALANSANKYARQTFRTNLDITPNKRLKISFDMNGAFTTLNEPNGITQVINVKDVWNDIWYYGALNPFDVGIRNPNGSWASNPYNGAASESSILAEGGYVTTNTTGLNFKLNANHQLDFITKGLVANVSAAYTSTSSDTRSESRGVLPAYYYNITANTYTNTNSTTQTPAYASGGANGSLTRTLSLIGSLSYDRTFNEVHHVSALVLYNQTSSDDRYLLPVNFTGFTSRFDYDFKNKYIFEFTLARNGTDKYQGSKRFGVFPAVAVGYNLAEERFFQNLFPFVDVLKLKGNVGIVGSDQGPAGGVVGQVYAAGGNYNFGANSGGTTALGILEGALINTDINWEQERKIDLGFELGLFKRLRLVGDYFDDYRYGQVLTPGNYSLIFGQTLGQYNLGRTSNKGFELQLTYNGQIGKVGYSVSPNISYAKNAIIYDGTVAAYPYQSTVGKQIGVSAGYVTDGFLTDQDIALIAAGKEAAPSSAVKAGFLKYRDINGDGIVDARDQVIIGKSNLPTTTFGMDLGFSYKGFRFDALFQGATDYSIKAYDRVLDLFNGNFQPIHLLSWTPATAATAKYPLLTTNGNYNYGKLNNSDFWYLNPTYVRLKQVQLSYALPAKFVQKLHLKNLSLTASAYNLLTWTNYDRNLFQIDPEVSSLSTASANATDKASSSTPNSSQYVFGVRLSF